MEFSLDNENIQIKVREDKKNHSNSPLSTQGNIFKKLNGFFSQIPSVNINSNRNSLHSPSDVIETSNNMSTSLIAEIFLKLNDYFLINNIKIFFESTSCGLPFQEININKLKFQNVSTGFWELAHFFNVDNKEIIVKENSGSASAMSIFCVGLTHYIKIQFLIRVEDEIEAWAEDKAGKTGAGSLANKKTFHLNLDTSSPMMKSLTERNSRTSMGKENNIEKESTALHIDIPQIIQKIKNFIKKITVFSQYIYSIPNSTFLMTLLNIKTFFGNLNLNLNAPKPYTAHMENNAECSLNLNCIENYLGSLFLTASSMIQARLFIQAWELLGKLQIYILNHITSNNFNFFRILLEVNLCQNSNLYLVSNSSEGGDENKNLNLNFCIPIFLTKIEIIKAVCMFEHGHMLTFLSSLKNCNMIYFLNDFSGIKTPISWTKSNEIGNDKFYIQNFLLNHGDKLGDILIMLLKDKSEITIYSSLKIIEFIIDYHPHILSQFFSKIIKILLNILYSHSPKIIAVGNTQTSSQPMSANDQQNKLMKIFSERKIYFPVDVLVNWFSNAGSNPSVSKSSSAIQKLERDNRDNNRSNSNISQILQKQINYTLDTITNNIENFSSKEICQIARKTNTLLCEIIKTCEKDSLIYIHATKLMRKLFENINSNIIDIFLDKNNFNYATEYQGQGNSPGGTIECFLNLLLMGVKPNLKNIFKEYLQFQNNLSIENKIKCKSVLKDTGKDLTQNSNIKNTVLSSLTPANNILDSSDTGNLVQFIIEKIAEDCFNFIEKKNYLQIFLWVQESLESTMTFIKNEGRDLGKDLKEFCIYYCYLLLQATNLIFFPTNKNELKEEVNNIFINNNHLRSTQETLMKLMNNFLNILFSLEEFTLSNRESFVLFELVIDIFSKIKDNFHSVFTLNFSVHFRPQYEILLKFISTSGIFTDNIIYILKTLPLCEITDDEQFIETLRMIFIQVLKNFSSYYNEEMFQLFMLLLTKLGNNLRLDEFLITECIRAIINKSNYKGVSFKQSCTKLFEVIFYNSINNRGEDKLSYYEIFRNNIMKGMKTYLESMAKYNSDKIKFKEFYQEFIEKIELVKKYCEFLIGIPSSEANENNTENCTKIVYLDQIISHLIFSNEEMKQLIFQISMIADDTTISKFNDLIAQNFEVLSNFLHLPKPNSLFTTIINYLECAVIYFSNVNKSKNIYLLSENFKSMTKIISIFNSFTQLPDISTAQDIINTRIKIYVSFLNSVSLQNLKDLPVKIITNDLMNFQETLIIKFKEFFPEIGIGEQCDSNLANLKEFLGLLLLDILNFHLDSNDDFQKIFGIEILFKFFNIKFDEIPGGGCNGNPSLSQFRQFMNSILNSINELSILNSIWEKILTLCDHPNYKIALFAIYIVQVIANKSTLTPLMSSSLAETKYQNELITLKDNPNRDNFWMTDKQVENLHNYIRDKIIFDYKAKITLDKNGDANANANGNENANTNAILLTNNSNIIDDFFNGNGNGNSPIERGIKADELNDYLDDCILFDQNTVNSINVVYEKEKDFKEKDYFLNTDNNNLLSGKIPNVGGNNAVQKSEENLTLEELGVFEVDDEIFENFNEENLPVLKNIYNRKKGSAEKLKTNQNARVLLMSNHIGGSTVVSKNEEQHLDEKDDGMVPGGAGVSNSTGSPNSQSQAHKQGYSNQNESIEKETKFDEDFVDMPDMTHKKRNIRPLNGLRPATPPLKQKSTSVSNNGGVEKNYSSNPYTQISGMTTVTVPSNNKYPRNNNASSGNQWKSCENIDKKYEIKSMEELFLEEEQEKNNGTHTYVQQPKGNVILGENIYDSFENLNLEDFKNMAHASEAREEEMNSENNNINGGFKMNMNMNVQVHGEKIKLPGYSYSNSKQGEIKIEEGCCVKENEHVDNVEKIDNLENNSEEDNLGEHDDNLDETPDEDSLEDFIGFTDDQKRLEFDRQRRHIQSNQIKTQRPPALFSNKREATLIKLSSAKDSTLLENKLTHLNVNNVLKNKNRFNKISSARSLIENSGHSISNININNAPNMNNTFNNVLSQRVYSPGSPNNKSTSQIPCNKQLSLSNIQSGGNKDILKGFNEVKNVLQQTKNIHNLHTIHKASAGNNPNRMQNMKNIQKNAFRVGNKQNTASEVKKITDFRSTLKLKLSKNSNKIFNNLRKLSQAGSGNVTQRVTGQQAQTLSLDINDEETFGGTINNSKRKSSHCTSINTNNFHESKNIGSNNKTPNFNYNI